MRIDVPGRIHLGLISMHSGAYRQNGGLGFAIDIPSVSLRYSPGHTNEVVDSRGFPLPCAQLDDLRHWAADAAGRLSLSSFGRFEILSGFPPHVGLGSGTATRLAILEIFCSVAGLDFDHELAVSLSGRGGASGIGLKTYFNGGFVFDLGRKNDGEAPRSSDDYLSVERAPLLIDSRPMPPWSFGLAILKGASTPIEKEREVFANVAVFSESDSKYALYHAIMGVQAAVSEGDKETFDSGVRALQSSRWKTREWDIQPEAIQVFRAFLERESATFIALSSMGPAVIFCADDTASVVSTAKAEFSDKFDLAMVSPQNSGRVFAK
ncbi:beta-ribofuranosylaminobenzene 5'-phosphate synthase family protein [Stenotrophomonas sp. AR026]|uniref:beta-ribofuranosylaminobenzene 5'-phosphate synthase family protein n=1 Tax=Stenotrophomonas sp. AR026 TaxID=3398462 RepID=UPI003BAE215B